MLFFDVFFIFLGEGVLGICEVLENTCGLRARAVEPSSEPQLRKLKEAWENPKPKGKEKGKGKGKGKGKAPRLYGFMMFYVDFERCRMM